MINLLTPTQSKYWIERIKNHPKLKGMTVLHTEKQKGVSAVTIDLPLFLVESVWFSDKEDDVVNTLIDKVVSHIIEHAGGEACLWHKYLLLRGNASMTIEKDSNSGWAELSVIFDYSILTEQQ